MPSSIGSALLNAVLTVGIAGGAAPPIYPGAVPATRPSGVAFKAPPAQAKTYVTGR